MDETEKTISILAFRKLLHELRDHRQGECIRFRKLGHMWRQNFMRVIEISETAAVFFDETIDEFVHSDLHDIVQFELEVRHQIYQPHFHYEVSHLTISTTSWQFPSRFIPRI
jgi:hypothetical protein